MKKYRVSLIMNDKQIADDLFETKEEARYQAGTWQVALHTIKQYGFMKSPCTWVISLQEQTTWIEIERWT